MSCVAMMGESSLDAASVLRERLARPRDVGRLWAPLTPELTYGRHRMPPPHHARHAAVLVLLYQADGEWHVPLIERTPDVTVHSRQVCFPGGRMEPGETPEQAAVREFTEELGAAPDLVQLCGRLTSMYIYASDFHVVPCVAVARERPAFVPNASEVASLLEPTLDDLADPGCLGSCDIHRRGLVFRAPHLEISGRRVWGATSMMLAELLAVVEGLA